MSAQPNPIPHVPQPDPDVPLREYLRHELTVNPSADPRADIDGILAALSTDQIEEAARYGVTTILGEITRGTRKVAMRQPDPGPKTKAAPRSAKWANASTSSRERPDLFAQRIVVGRDEHGQEQYAFLGDCDRVMLKDAAALLRDHGNAVHAATHGQADRYDALRRKLRGAATVRTLPLATVEKVLDPDA